MGSILSAVMQASYETPEAILYNDVAVPVISTGVIGFSFVIGLILYIYVSYALMVIAKKQSIPDAWMAFIPVLNAYIIVKIAGYSGWSMLIFLLPIIGILFLIWTWMKIAEKRGFSQYLGLLVVLPVANIILPGVLAWVDPKVEQK